MMGEDEILEKVRKAIWDAGADEYMPEPCWMVDPRAAARAAYAAARPLIERELLEEMMEYPHFTGRQCMTIQYFAEKTRGLKLEMARAKSRNITLGEQGA